MSKAHGLVLDRHEIDYIDLTKFGEIRIFHDPHNGVQIEVKGFEFRHSNSCRQSVTKAMAWARDVLTNAVHADKLVPGGQITSADAGSPDDAP